MIYDSFKWLIKIILMLKIEADQEKGYFVPD